MQQYYPDIPRICTALAEWGACMTYLYLVKPACYRKPAFWIKNLLVLAFQSIFLMATENVTLALWLPCMVVAVASMYCFIKVVGKISFLASAYCCVQAFLTAEFVASLEWQIMMYIGGMSFSYPLFTTIHSILVVLTYGGCFVVLVHLQRGIFSEDYLNQLTGREVVAAGGIAIAIFAFSNLSFLYKDLPFTGSESSDIFFIRTLVDFSGIAILYIYQSRIHDYIVKNELSAINSLLKSQYRQYQSYQDNQEFIHIKYHDLKHQIAGLRMETNEEKRRQWLDAMEEELSSFENISRTGNHVLDTMLAAKIFSCRKHQIQITCVADGNLLNFMSVMDICSIFGNALDNAIECEAQIPEAEKRLIHVTVSGQKGFVLIGIENYCEETIRKDEGKWIQTTKSDKQNHGFGLRSIIASVEKYGGVVDFGQKNDWFTLKILIPRDN